MKLKQIDKEQQETAEEVTANLLVGKRKGWL